MKFVICSVCGKKVTTKDDLLTEHNDKRNNLCYGSYMPIHDINPFKKQRRTIADYGLDLFSNVDPADIS